MIKNIHRRLFLGAMASMLALSASRRVSAAVQTPLQLTPRDSEGPFYPHDHEFMDDRDNDLVRIIGNDDTSLGQILHLEGTVRDRSGASIEGVLVEIWQCDANGRYLHPADQSRSRPRDDRFQGYGRTITDAEGRYSFRTIKPVPYPGRTPHIHMKIHNPRDGSVLTTQMYVAGELQNNRDFLYQRMSKAERRAATATLRASADNTFRAEFNIVI